MKIAQLRPSAQNVDLHVKALSLNEVRNVVSKQDGVTHRVTEALVGDDSGTVLLTLWDDAIDSIKTGKSYDLANGFASLFQKSLRLNLGRNGTLTESASAVAEVKEENNLSEAPLDLKISDLKPNLRKVDLVVRVLSKNAVREVVSKQDGVSHRVTEALIGDASGTVLLTLWDDAIDSVEEGASYKIGNAFTGVFQNTIRLNLGRNGTLEAAATPVENVDESNNMSLKEFKAKSRFGGSDRGDRGGQRGFGGSRDNEYGSAGDY